VRVALSQSDVETARKVVTRLRAEHADREAAVIERLMQQALAGAASEVALAGFMTTGDAARLIGVSLQTVKNWVRDGRLTGRRVGGRMLVTRSSVRDFFDSLGSSPDNAEATDVDVDATEAADRELVASLPQDQTNRVEGMLERSATGQRLSRSERQELRDLAEAGTTTAINRTRKAVSQSKSQR
jgi:excisionase family DNA binding protein